MSSIVNASVRGDALLRRAIVGDGLVTGAVGLLLAAGASPLSDLFGLPSLLLRVTGITLLPYAALVATLGTRAVIARRGAWAVVGANLVWTAASLLLLVSGSVSPTATGYAFVILQALLVMALADAQILGLRRAA